MIFYEVDIKTPTTVTNDDGWRPVMDGEARRRFTSDMQLARFLDSLGRSNAALKYRVREVQRETFLRKL